MGSLKLKVGRCPKYITVLENIPASGKSSRMRSRLIKELDKFIIRADEEIKDVVDIKVKKVEGVVQTTLNSEGINEYQFNSGKDKLDFINQVNEIKSESIVLEGESKLEMLNTVYELLETSPVQYVGEEALVYDELCTAFENFLLP